ncbi:MAG: HPr(Ser) kinase/phosphatase [Acidobacteria bacterium]|nr:HPr(Ser) kinase/phosphatase [Acidobacteriota bacterium]
MSASVPVASLLGARGAGADLEFDLLAGAAGLERRITLPHIQKTGLALAGFDEYLRPGRVLVFGESEVRYLERMEPPARRDALARLFGRDFPCVVLTLGLDPPPELVAEAERVGVPVLRTSASTPTAIARLTTVLEDRMAAREVLHGVLLDILGLGVLIAGESGIGKSECALDLVGRGHRLVADDTVEVKVRGESVLIGSCPELTRHYVEIRGLGLVNVTDLFGVTATRASKRIELVVQLERWELGREYDRLGLTMDTQEILGVAIPLIRMPVAPGRNVAMLVEVAARNSLLRSRGRHAAQRLAERLEHRLARAAERQDSPDLFTRIEDEED